MKVRRIIIISLLAALAAVIAGSLIYAAASVNAAKKTCEKYLALKRRSVLPPEYCFENENLTMDDRTFDALIDSLCGEAAPLTTDSGLRKYRELITSTLKKQAAKEFTVSRREIEVREWRKIKFVAVDEIEFTVELEERVTLYLPIDGVISKDPVDRTVQKYTFTLKNVSGSWKIS
ncbi:MAG: hypothetical protein J6T65_08440 [Clostridia bacterium]|nr:hypothetical protein [Clostridia bacterium]